MEVVMEVEGNTNEFVVDQKEHQIYSKNGKFEATFLLNEGYLGGCETKEISWDKTFITITLTSGSVGDGGSIVFSFDMAQKIVATGNGIYIYFGEVKE